MFLIKTQGYRQKGTYIATQGPLESTVCDFWRMVWENENKCVVLLTQLKENNKVCVHKITQTNSKHDIVTGGLLNIKTIRRRCAVAIGQRLKDIQRRMVRYQ